MTTNPISIGIYEFDLAPTVQQAAVLERIQMGDRIVTARGGRGWVWQHGGRTPGKALIQRLIDNQWIVRPHVDGPLFGRQDEGRLTSRGLSNPDGELING